MTPLLRSLFLVLPLVGLLTWLLVYSVGPSGNDLVIAQRDVARVSLSEAALRNDVLQARIGLVLNYDQLGEDMKTLSLDVNDLQRQGMVRKGDENLLEALKEKVGNDDIILEQFKSDNALLHNSLAYFDVLDTRLAAQEENLPLTIALARLANAMLELSRHPTVTLQHAVTKELDLVSSLTATSGVTSADLSLLLIHGYLLARLLPAVENDVAALFRISTYELRQQVRQSQDARRSLSEKKAARYRLALYSTALILLAVLVRVALQWRSGLKLLRRRAQIEGAIARITLRLLSSDFDDYAASIDDVLAMLGTSFGADRTYLIKNDLPRGVRTWCGPGVELPSSWPGSLLEETVALPPHADDLIELSVSAEPRSTLTDMLAGRAVRCWCGVVLRCENKPAALLGFDRTRTAQPWPKGDTGLLRMAAEVVQSALQRREALAARLELESRINRGRRLEAIGVFASGIAHNFNNIVGAMLGHAEMVADAVPSETAVAQHAGEILRAGDRAKELVACILDFGTRRGDRYRQVSMGILLSETISMLRVMLPTRIDLIVESHAQESVVRGDAPQLQQIILNLIRNAEQAIREKGTITVRLNAMTLQDPKILSGGMVSPGHYVGIRVSDTGLGMDEHTQASIFDPFFTTRPAGTGLGLATVWEIVQDHGGCMDVGSAPGEGSVFSVWLPVAGDQPERSSLKHDGAGKVVLVLGQSQSTVLRDEEMVAALGYEPIGFSNVEEAIAAARSHPFRFDALLISPPEHEEVKAGLKVLRELLPSMPLILVTSASYDKAYLHWAGFELTACLRRPISLPRLNATLSESIGPGAK